MISILYLWLKIKKDGSSIRKSFKKVERPVFLVGYYEQQNIDTCRICCPQEDKLRWMTNVSISFISGSSNCRLSALKDHDNSACHQRVPFMKNSMKKPLQLKNLYCQEKFSVVHLFQNHPYI